MTNNNWIEELNIIFDLFGETGWVLPRNREQKIESFISNLLTKKDQEHKAELESIKEEVGNILGYSICSAHQTWNESCKLCGNAPILKEDAVAILDSHINKL